MKQHRGGGASICAYGLSLVTVPSGVCHCPNVRKFGRCAAEPLPKGADFFAKAQVKAAHAMPLRRRPLCLDQGCGSGLDPDSETLWIRTRGQEN
jgi:hypothetical protein